MVSNERIIYSSNQVTTDPVRMVKDWGHSVHVQATSSSHYSILGRYIVLSDDTFSLPSFPSCLPPTHGPPSYLQKGWNWCDVVEEDTVEGAVDAIVDIAHERLLSLSRPFLPFADDTHHQSMSGTGKVPTWGECSQGVVYTGWLTL